VLFKVVSISQSQGDCFVHAFLRLKHVFPCNDRSSDLVDRKTQVMTETLRLYRQEMTLRPLKRFSSSEQIPKRYYQSDLGHSANVFSPPPHLGVPGCWCSKTTTLAAIYRNGGCNGNAALLGDGRLDKPLAVPNNPTPLHRLALSLLKATILSLRCGRDFQIVFRRHNARLTRGFSGSSFLFPGYRLPLYSDRLVGTIVGLGEFPVRSVRIRLAA